MLGIDSLNHSFGQIMGQSFEVAFRTLVQWKGRGIQWITHLPEQMKNHQHVAVLVFLSANAIFLTLVNLLAYHLDERFTNSIQKLDPVNRAANRLFNDVLIDVVVVGSLVATFNTSLAYYLKYPLSKTMLAVITLSAIALRIILSDMYAEEDEFTLRQGNFLHAILITGSWTFCCCVNIFFPHQAERTKENINIEPSVSEVGSEGDELPCQEVGVEEEQPISLQSLTLKQEKFIHNFCTEIEEYLREECQHVNFSAEHMIAHHVFLEELKGGMAVVENTPDFCCAVNISIQAVLESLIVEKLDKGEITEANVFFLTELPSTPLRRSPKNIDPTIEVDWDKWTVEKRTQTVRELREAGAQLTLGYSAKNYQTFPLQSPQNLKEFNKYESEKEHPLMIDLSLTQDVPKEIIGAVYIFFDQESDSCYTLTMQGSQSHPPDQTDNERWKMWFGVSGSNPPGDHQSQEMLTFIKTHQIAQKK